MKRFSRILSVDIIAKASGFILLPVYLKLMTQAEFGLYGYIFSIIGVFALVLNFGLYVAQIRLYPVYDCVDRGAMLFTVNALLGGALSVLLIGAFLCRADYAIVSFLFSHQINYEAYRTLVFLSLISTVFALMVHTYFIASEKIKLIQSNNLAKAFLVNAVVIYFLFISSGDAVYTRLKYVFISEFALLIFFGRFLVKKMRFKFRFDIAKRSLKIGIPIMLSAFFAMLYNLSDRFFLEKYSGFEILAIYNLGVTIAGAITILSASFQIVYLPLFFKEKDPVINLKNVKKIVKTAVPGLLLLAGGIIFVCWCMSRANIIGKEYQSVVTLLPFLFIYSILQMVTQLYINFLVYFEVMYMIVLVSIVTNAINIMANIILIPRFSIYGAASATVIATTISFLAFFFYAKKRVSLAMS